ncbi:hypothetical protein [Microbacterium aurum]
MSTTTPLTPPPVAGPPTTPGSPGSPGAPGGPGRPPRRTTARVIAILAIVVGGILILGTVTAGIFSAVRAATLRTETFTADATGIAALDIDISGGVAHGRVRPRCRTHRRRRRGRLALQTGRRRAARDERAVVVDGLALGWHR